MSGSPENLSGAVETLTAAYQKLINDYVLRQGVAHQSGAAAYLPGFIGSRLPTTETLTAAWSAKRTARVAALRAIVGQFRAAGGTMALDGVSPITASDDTVVSLEQQWEALSAGMETLQQLENSLEGSSTGTYPTEFAALVSVFAGIKLQEPDSGEDGDVDSGAAEAGSDLDDGVDGEFGLEDRLPPPLPTSAFTLHPYVMAALLAQKVPRPVLMNWADFSASVVLDPLAQWLVSASEFTVQLPVVRVLSLIADAPVQQVMPEETDTPYAHAVKSLGSALVMLKALQHKAKEALLSTDDVRQLAVAGGEAAFWKQTCEALRPDDLNRASFMP